MKVEVLLRCTLRGEPFCFSLQRTGDIDRRSLYHDGEVFIFPVELNEGVVAFQKKSVVSCSLLLRSWDPRNILSLSQVKIWCTWTPMISFGKKMKTIFLILKKKVKKYSLVANYLSHQRAKNLVQILCILGYTK
jgi:hypothetical protein